MGVDEYLIGLMEIHREVNIVLGQHKRSENFFHTNHARKKCREIEEDMMKFIPKNILKIELWPDL